MHIDQFVDVCKDHWPVSSGVIEYCEKYSVVRKARLMMMFSTKVSYGDLGHRSSMRITAFKLIILHREATNGRHIISPR